MSAHLAALTAAVCQKKPFSCILTASPQEMEEFPTSGVAFVLCTPLELFVDGVAKQPAFSWLWNVCQLSFPPPCLAFHQPLATPTISTVYSQIVLPQAPCNTAFVETYMGEALCIAVVRFSGSSFHALPYRLTSLLSSVPYVCVGGGAGCCAASFFRKLSLSWISR